MTGVDPRIPIKPHESEYRGEAAGGRAGGEDEGPGADLLTPANSLQ